MYFKSKPNNFNLKKSSTTFTKRLGDVDKKNGHPQSSPNLLKCHQDYFFDLATQVLPALSLGSGQICQEIVVLASQYTKFRIVPTGKYHLPMNFDIIFINDNIIPIGLFGSGLLPLLFVQSSCHHHC